MRLVKVGEQFINMDMVTEVLRFSDGGIKVYFATPAHSALTDDNQVWTEIDGGEEADALYRWLCQNAESVTQ